MLRTKSRVSKLFIYELLNDLQIQTGQALVAQRTFN